MISRTLAVASLCSLLAAPSFARLDSFTGVYFLGSVGYRNTSTKINYDKNATQESYKLTGGNSVFQVGAGMGKAWKRLYLGYELTAGINSGRIKKKDKSLGSKFQFGFSARIGAPIPEASIMPYIGLGFEYRQMDFKTNTTSAFSNYALGPFVGFECIVNEDWRFRGEAGYQMSLRATNLPADYKFKSKPSSFLLKATAVYKITGA